MTTLVLMKLVLTHGRLRDVDGAGVKGFMVRLGYTDRDHFAFSVALPQRPNQTLKKTTINVQRATQDPCHP